MIDAVMYGMMPSANTATRRERAAGEEVEEADDAGAARDSKNFCSASRSTPGTGT